MISEPRFNKYALFDMCDKSQLGTNVTKLMPIKGLMLIFCDIFQQSARVQIS